MGRYLAKKKMRMAEQEDLGTNAEMLPEQEQLIRSATETIGNACVCWPGLASFELGYLLISFHRIVLSTYKFLFVS